MKVGPRNAMVIAVVSLALSAGDELRASFGSAGPRPVLVTAPREEADTFAERVAAAASPIDDVRGSAAYRRHALRGAHDARAREDARRMRISLRVNGVEAEADCWEGESLLYALREKLGYPGLEERLRAGRVRLVLGAARRDARLRVPRARRAGRRPRRDDGRGARRRRASCTRCSEAFVETGRGAVRLLHAGPRRRRRRPARADARPVRRRDPRGALRQPLPLHGLREDLRRGPPGRAGRSAG